MVRIIVSATNIIVAYTNTHNIHICTHDTQALRMMLRISDRARSREFGRGDGAPPMYARGQHWLHLLHKRHPIPFEHIN